MLRRALTVIMLVACGTKAPPSSPPLMYGGDRPVELEIPAVIQAHQKFPLLVVLHDYGATGDEEASYLGLTGHANDRSFVLAPDGITDSMGKQFWNADPSCCDFDHKNPDDVAYLTGVIATVVAAWPIDPNAVAVVGHGNGGTMAYRLACDRSDLVSNVVVLGGQMPSTTCAATRPVNVLHIHGTSDDKVPYAAAAPSAQQWAVNDRCGAGRVLGPAVDVDAVLAGSETLTESMSGCPTGVAVDLWTIEQGGHIPTLVGTFAPTVRDWVISNRRP
jgi:polyhydroxybutyrate depolymerase